MFFLHSCPGNSEVLGLSQKTVMYLKFLKYFRVQASAVKKKSDVEFIFKNAIVICKRVYFSFLMECMYNHVGIC